MRFLSPSKRTRVQVDLDQLGAGTVVITRDGQTVHSFTLMREPGTRYEIDPEKVRNAS